MPDPLPGDENRQFDVKLDLAHLERGGVPVAHQVADQSGILLYPLGAAAIGDPGRLHDGVVISHVVDDADEAVIEDRNGLIQQGLERRHGGPSGGRGCGLRRAGFLRMSRPYAG